MGKTARSYKYRLYPNQKQAERLDYMLWQGRKVWNGALEMWKECYKVNGCSPHPYDLRDYWCAQRKVDPDGIGVLPFATVDDLTRRLKKAYDAAFRRLAEGCDADEAGWPRFKSRRTFRGLGFVYGRGIKLRGEGDKWAKLYVMNCGLIRLRYHRPLPDNATPKMVMVNRDRQGRWFASIQVQFESKIPAPHLGPAVGIDVGLVYLLALSDGTVIEHPHWYQEMQRQRRILSRKIDRQLRANNPQNYNEGGTVKKNAVIWRKSTRLRKTEAQKRKMEDKIAQERWYFWHTVTDWLTNTYGLIAIEDLKLDFMTQNGRLAKSTYDAGLSMFWEMLEYKCAERGVELVRVAPQYTSQCCSECGVVSADNRQTQANFMCVSCGYTENADINAAKNILRIALRGAVQAPRGGTEAIGPEVPCEGPISLALTRSEL